MSVSTANINYNNKSERCVIMFRYTQLKVYDSSVYFSIKTNLILLFLSYFLFLCSQILGTWECMALKEAMCICLHSS